LLDTGRPSACRDLESPTSKKAHFSGQISKSPGRVPQTLIAPNSQNRLPCARVLRLISASQPRNRIGQGSSRDVAAQVAGCSGRRAVAVSACAWVGGRVAAGVWQLSCSDGKKRVSQRSRAVSLWSVVSRSVTPCPAPASAEIASRCLLIRDQIVAAGKQGHKAPQSRFYTVQVGVRYPGGCVDGLYRIN